jgi:tetratricopeptide (TPR) repeat protein
VNSDPTDLEAGSARLDDALRGVALAPREARAWQLLGFAYGELQRIPDAVRAFAEAARLAPDEPRTAFCHAQASLDAGYPAAALFAHARALAPGDLKTVAGEAAALAAHGDRKAAEALLSDALRTHPDWLAGHKQLAALRFTAGDSQHFADSYAAACNAEPRNLPLRLAWFGALAQVRDWEAAAAVIAAAEAIMGTLPALAAARAVLAGESGDLERADDWFARTASIRDDALAIAHVRHCLRTGQVERAERLALDLLPGRSAPLAWPYLSIIWRLRGDARAPWLDGAPPHVRTFDLGYSASELDALAAVLRRLHTARAAHLEQSVRGGTQTDTDRQLFFRAEPELQTVRARVSAAIREYVAGLPAPVPGHPLLAVPRGRIRFSGSWSVRLMAQGHHVSHTHPLGWISSALYVSLPAHARLGPAPAGWIRFGVPPAVLGLNLPALAQLEPKPGRLILFPSTMWHETLPFDDGERLVIAFDVMRP